MKKLRSILIPILIFIFSIIVISIFYNSFQIIKSEFQVQNTYKEEENISVISDISLNSSYSSILVKDKDNVENLYMWGNLYNNNNEAENYFIPININVDASTPGGEAPGIQGTVTFMDTGRNSFGIVIKDEKNIEHLYMWGRNDAGQLGNGNWNDTNIPDEIDPDGTINRDGTPDGIQGQVTQFNLGSYSSSIVIKDTNNIDHLYVWGWNKGGQLGNETTENINEPTEMNIDQYVDGGGDPGIQGTVTNFSLGALTSVITIKGYDGIERLYTWTNDNRHGTIGDGTNNNSLIPVEINVDASTPGGEALGIQGDITSLAQGPYNIQVVIKDNDGVEHLYVWGKNDYGQLGNGTQNPSNFPIEINVDEGEDGIQGTVTSSSVGTNHSSIVIEDKLGIEHFYLWGGNDYGQLGDGTQNNNYLPTEINIDGGDPGIQGKIIELSLGRFSTGLIIQGEDKINRLYIYGDNSSGQTGIGKASQMISNPIEIFPYFTDIPQNVTINSVSIIEDSIEDTTAILQYSINIPVGDHIKTQNTIVTKIEVTDGINTYGFIDNLNESIITEKGEIKLLGLTPEQDYDDLYIVIYIEGQESGLTAIINENDSIKEGHISKFKLSISMILLYTALAILIVGSIIGLIIGWIWYSKRKELSMNME